MSAVVIPLPWTKPPLSLNDRGHWRPRAARIAKVREEVGYIVRAAKVRPREQATVTLCWRVPDRRRRDLDNMFATLKPTIDALVDVGVLPADDWQHVRPGARILPPDGQSAMWVELDEWRDITEREAAVGP